MTTPVPHPTAVIHPRAKIGEGCVIGPFCVIGEHVVLGDRCTLHSHVVVDGHTTLGPGNQLFPFACVGLQSQDLKYKGGITRTEIGEQNTFREHVTIHSATADGGVTRVGSHNHLLAYSHIAHDVRLGSHIIISNVGTLAGHVTVDDYAVIGGLGAVHQFCRVGKLSMIGGCSKVVQDVPPFMIVDGNPAQTRALNKISLERNGIEPSTQTALKQAYKILFREGLTTSNAAARIEGTLPLSPELMHLLEFVRTSERGLSK